MTLDRIVETMDLADFLGVEQERIGYRALVAKTGVSKGSLEHIINRENKKQPDIETLQAIAKGFDMKLWEVMQLAVDLELPQAPTELGQRIAAIVARHPKLGKIFERLQAIEHQRPDLVTGMIITIEVLDRQRKQRRPPPPNPPKERRRSPRPAR